MTCPSCGTPSDLDRKSCGECGAPLARACPNCGSPNGPTVRFIERLAAATGAPTPAERMREAAVSVGHSKAPV